MNLIVTGSNVPQANQLYIEQSVLNNHPVYITEASDAYIWFDGMTWRMGFSAQAADDFWHTNGDSEGNSAPLGEWPGQHSEDGMAQVADASQAPLTEEFSEWSDPANATAQESVTYQGGKVTGFDVVQVGSNFVASWTAYGGATGYELRWKEGANGEWQASERTNALSLTRPIGGASFFQYGIPYVWQVRAFRPLAP